MSPFIAAFVACSGFACFIVVFGILLPGHHRAGARPARSARIVARSARPSHGHAA
jgi:hypothetical protein